ncbi:MAG: sugar ABC transporter permease, partial [Deinococcus sp.]|nr:sugar ABC transporter permease [Deinococcus sp.]
MRHLPLVGRRWQDAFTAYGILAPSLLLLTLFVYYPALNTLWQSFQFRNLRLPNRRGFSGLDNYLRLLRGTELWASLERSLLVVAYTLPLLLILGLLAALILHAPFPGRGVVRTIAILPWMLPPLVNGFMWSWVLNGDYGALNGLLYQLGLIREYQHWMGVPALQLMWVSLAHVWTRYPFPMLVILAA